MKGLYSVDGVLILYGGVSVVEGRSTVWYRYHITMIYLRA